MSLAEVEIHFREMSQISDDIAQIAEQLQKIIRGMGIDAVNGVKVAWESEGTDIFIGKAVKRLGVMEKRTGNLQELARDIQNRATQIYAVEVQNELRAITRRYY